MMRIGYGVDIHPFEKGRPLILAGTEIPHHSGLGGHSDADVVTHALCDALLGALALGDIGTHFPDSDAAYQNCNSLFFLREIMKKLSARQANVMNTDISIVMEQPKLSPYIPQMQQTLATAMGINSDCVSLKATTSEGLGFVGREEGVVAYAVVLLEVE